MALSANRLVCPAISLISFDHVADPLSSLGQRVDLVVGLLGLGSTATRATVVDLLTCRLISAIDADNCSVAAATVSHILVEASCGGRGHRRRSAAGLLRVGGHQLCRRAQFGGSGGHGAERVGDRLVERPDQPLDSRLALFFSGLIGLLLGCEMIRLDHVLLEDFDGARHVADLVRQRSEPSNSTARW